MKDQFADYETAKMLKGLGFDEKSLALYTDKGRTFSYTSMPHTNINSFYVNYKKEVVATPTWCQVEEWLYKNKKIMVSIQSIHLGSHYLGGVYHKGKLLVKREMVKALDYQDCPIELKITALKLAVKYLHENQL